MRYGENVKYPEEIQDVQVGRGEVDKKKIKEENGRKSEVFPLDEILFRDLIFLSFLWKLVYKIDSLVK